MNIFLQRAAQYMGVRKGDQLSKTDEKRLRAKAKKMKISEKKTRRRNDGIL
jgi:hypothetical protein